MAKAPLNFPDFSLHTKTHPERGEVIWDALRKKWLVLTPEEWVRQHMVHYMLSAGYPAESIAIEAGIKVNGLTKRCDIVAYSKGQPLMIVECKAPSVPIDQAVFDQAARYNLTLNTPYIAVTNGVKHVFAQIHNEEKKYIFLPEIPQHI
ncbi:MAG: type I restriction enzyme HsdR N-terminal domain-containing protein [Schleiferiaceae bacterium]